MSKLPLVAIALISTLASGAAAQTHVDLARCRAITDDGRRLECYDSIAGPRPSLLSKYEVVPLEDFRSFALGYRGRFVELSGWLKLIDNNAEIGVDEDDPDPVPIELEGLSRQEIMAIRDACPESCEATVKGKAAPVFFTTGIIADVVIVH